MPVRVIDMEEGTRLRSVSYGAASLPSSGSYGAASLPSSGSYDAAGTMVQLLQPGDEIIAIDGQAVDDIIDFKFLSAGDDLVITCRRDGELLQTAPLPGDYVSGLTVDDPYFSVKTCANRCLFCFVEQLPP
ncbi:MAG: hypothetical protein PHT33_06540, partial [bacterium]|nr:hypothetical protein [bacterium]